MLRRRLITYINALSPVFSGLLSIVIVTSSVGTIVTIGAPYVETINQKSISENAELQIRSTFEAINKLTSSKSGDQKVINLDLGSRGSVSVDKEKDRIILMYSIDPDYDFLVNNLGFNEDKDRFFIKMIGETKITSVIASRYNIQDTCFLKGTKVLMADETYKSIEKMNVGDLVKAYNEKTGEIQNCKVIEVFHHEPDEMPDYYLVINDKLKLTPNHRIYSDGEWVFAADLKIGDVLYTYNKTNYFITSIQKIFNRVPTYDIEIQELHTYFVSIYDNVDVLVHNPTSPSRLAVETIDASEITSSSVQLNGFLTNDGGEPCEIAFIISLGDAEIVWSGSYTTGESFSSFIEGLEPNTEYNFQAGAKNSADEVWGEILTFETGSDISPPSVITSDASNIGTNSVTLNGYIQSDGGDTCLVRFRYRIISSSNWIYPSNWIGYYYDLCTFSENLDGLSTNTNYEYQAGASNSIYTVWGTSKYFTTDYGNEPPIAVDDYAKTKEDEPVLIDVLANDYDPHGQILYISFVSSPNHGTAEIDSNKIIYTPSLNYYGEDEFTYVISNNLGGTDAATVYVEIMPVNDKPVISKIPNQEIIVGGSFTDISLDNYVYDDDPVEDLIWSVTGGYHISVTIEDRIAIITIQETSWLGSEEIVFTATDTGGLSDSCTVVFTVSPKINTAPVRNNNKNFESKAATIEYDEEQQIYLITTQLPIEGIIVFDLIDEEYYFGSIWVFDSDSITFLLSSKNNVKKLILENGGIIEITDSTNEPKVKNNPIISDNNDVLYLSISQLVKKTSSASVSSGDSCKININFKANVLSRTDTMNSISSFRIQLYGDNSEVWKQFYLSYNFVLEPDTHSLRYNKNGVSLVLWHSLMIFDII